MSVIQSNTSDENLIVYSSMFMMGIHNTVLISI